MNLSGYDYGEKRKHLMDIPNTTHLVTNGCEISPSSTYLIGRESKVYIYLSEIGTAVESEYSFARDDNGNQLNFSADRAKYLPNLSMEASVEKVNNY